MNDSIFNGTTKTIAYLSVSYAIVDILVGRYPEMANTKTQWLIVINTLCVVLKKLLEKFLGDGPTTRIQQIGEETSRPIERKHELKDTTIGSSEGSEGVEVKIMGTEARGPKYLAE